MFDVLKKLLHTPQGVAGLGILLLALITVCAGVHLAPADPEAISIL
ncbi:ABC transporter permease, partial [Pectobacterium versatile]|nr:ABC transporter permease [Pectobacterium versatile]